MGLDRRSTVLLDSFHSPLSIVSESDGQSALNTL
jgi:hypothetical protein